jgi:hypothetical protein
METVGDGLGFGEDGAEICFLEGDWVVADMMRN